MWKRDAEESVTEGCDMRKTRVATDSFEGGHEPRKVDSFSRGL